MQAQFGEIASSLKPDLHGQFTPHYSEPLHEFWGQPYHLLAGGDDFQLRCDYPSYVAVSIAPIVGAANDISNHFAFIAVDALHGEAPILKLRVSDLHPAISAATETRIDGWIRRVLSMALAELHSSFANTLKQLPGTTP